MGINQYRTSHPGVENVGPKPIEVQGTKETTEDTQAAVKDTQANLDTLSEEIKMSAMFEKTLLEIEQVVQITNKAERKRKLEPLLQRFRESPALRTILFQKVQQQKEHFGKDKKQTLKTKREVLITQIYGNVFYDATILVDGIVGQQTRDVVAAVGVQETSLTQRAKLWQTKDKTIMAEQTREKTNETGGKKVQPFSAPSPTLSSRVTLQNMTTSSALVSNPDLYHLVTSREKVHITSAQETQRKREALFSVSKTFPELQHFSLHSFFNPQTGTFDDEALRSYLLSQHFSAEKVEKILTTLHDGITTYVEQKKQEFLLQQNLPTLKALEQLFAYIRGYLDYTTKNEQVNFLQEFNFNLQQGIKVVGDRVEMSGSLSSTPLRFSYEMSSGNFAINTLLQPNHKTGAYDVNANSTPHLLFQLPLFTTLEQAAQQGNMKTPEISPFFQETLAFQIEKNRAIATVFSLFDIPSLPQYTQMEHPGMYHLCALLDNSLTTLDTCKEFREEMQRLSTLINRKPLSLPSDPEENPLTEKNRIPQYISAEQDKQLMLRSPLLGQLFNTKKREQDKRKDANDRVNGLYLFLKRATPQITKLDTTYYEDLQKINVMEISNYLTFVEQEKEQQYTGFITRT